jgi:hypothetical protein
MVTMEDRRVLAAMRRMFVADRDRVRRDGTAGYIAYADEWIARLERVLGQGDPEEMNYLAEMFLTDGEEGDPWVAEPGV